MATTSTQNVVAKRLLVPLMRTEAGVLPPWNRLLAAVPRMTAAAPARKGVFVAEVVTQGPADKAGLHAGDLITSVDGQSVASVHDVQKVVWLRGAGEALRVEVQRDGQKKSVLVTSEPMPLSH